MSKLIYKLEKYMKILITIIICTSSTWLIAGNMFNNPALNKIRKQKVIEHDALSIVKDAKAQAVVIIPALKNAGNSEENKALKQINLITRQAALELIKYVKAVTGAELPLQTADEALPPGKKLILVGESKWTKDKGISAQDLPLEGFRIQSFPEGVAIVGRMPDKRENFDLGGGYYVLDASAAQSIRFGVYDFLERFCGVRWYYPGELGTYIPHKRDLLIPACHYTDWPEFSKRSGAHWLFYHNPAKTVNNHIGTEKYSPFFRAGDSSYVEFGCHSPNNFGVHREKNPECFELSNNGKRDENFPCYGNPKTIDLMLDDMSRFYETGNGESYKARKNGKLWCPPTKNRVVVSPPDKNVICNCKYCKKLWRNDLGYYGQASGILCEFTSDFAKKVATKYPNVKVLFLPYMNYLTCPENTKLPSNVVPFVCLTYGTANQKEPAVENYNTCVVNNWAKAVDNKVIVWEYLCWPAENTFMPFQYSGLIKRFYLKNRGKILGIFVDGHLSRGGRRVPVDTTPGGEWAYSHPTIYCWYRLMWNPEFDDKAALDEYCTLMYGPAASEMKKILNLLASRWGKIKWKDGIRNHNVEKSQIHDETMPKNEVEKLAELLKKAEKLVGQKTLCRKRLDFFGTAIKKFIEASRQYHLNADKMKQMEKELIQLEKVMLTGNKKTFPGTISLRVSEAKLWPCGKYTPKLVKDSKSALGFTIYQPGNNRNWAVHWNQLANKPFAKDTVYVIRIHCRIDKKNDTGNAFACRMYNPVTNNYPCGRAFKANNIDMLKYKWLTVGKVVPAKDDYLYTSPYENPSVSGIYIDAVELIPEKEIKKARLSRK